MYEYYVVLKLFRLLSCIHSQFGVLYRKTAYKEVIHMLSIYLSLVDTPQKKTLVEEIYYKYKSLMYTVSFSYLHNVEDAEDAVHEAFVRIIKNITKIEDADCTKTKAFVVTVVKNISIDILKKKKPIIDMSIDDYDLPIGGPSCEDEAIGNTDVEILKRAMKRLPDSYYEILLLEIYYNCSTENLASLLGINHENAKSRLRRARLKLKNILKEMDYE